MPQTQLAGRRTTPVDADDSSVAFENLAKSYSSRKVEQAVIAEGTQIAQRSAKGAGDYLPISPLKRKQGQS